jgi:CheY-like chemotaxis protein
MPPHLSFRPRVLIVDDAGASRAALRALLEGRGFRVEEAADGAAGLRKAMAWRPEAAVVGTDVPPSGGCAVARGLRAVFGPGILVIGRTRPGRPLDPERARSDGFDHALSDTADPSDLLALLRPAPASEGVAEVIWVGSPG